MLNFRYNSVMQKLKFRKNNLVLDIRDEVDKSVLAEIFKFEEYRCSENVIVNAKNPVIDAGAHIGLFSIYVRCLNKTVKIYALEPEQDNIIRLKCNLAENFIKNVEVIKCSLSGKTGVRELFLSADSHNHSILRNTYHARLHRCAKQCSPRFDHRVEAGGQVARNKIMTKTTDFKNFCEQNCISRVSLLKMDIEGAEFEVIKNLQPTDFAKINAIVFEYHNSSTRNCKTLQEILRKNGFSVEAFASQFDKNMGIIFAHRKI